MLYLNMHGIYILYIHICTLFLVYPIIIPLYGYMYMYLCIRESNDVHIYTYLNLNVHMGFYILLYEYVDLFILICMFFYIHV